MGTVLDIILYNPHRILGVYTNTHRKDILSNKGKATAFLTVGRPVEYPLDLNGILPPLKRTLETMDAADAHLSVAKEQIKYAQFWFMRSTMLDDIAYNHLLAGDINGALGIWSKQDDLSSLQNKLVCELIGNNYSLAIRTAEKLYDNYGVFYINKIDPGSTLKMTAIELLHQFLDSLSEEVGVHKLLCCELSDDIKAYVSSKAVGPLINKISSEVKKAKIVDHKDPEARIEAARKLVANTKEPFAQLKSILPATDSQYQMIADKLGLEILQCGIDYFIGMKDSDDEAPFTAMKMLKYARTIVVGSLAVGRCDDQIRELQKYIDNLPPKAVMAEDKAIKAELAKFVRLPDKISYAVTLLNNTKPHLQSIKRKLGATNAYYLKLSTQIVGNALHNVIEEVNEAQEPLAKLSELLSGMNPYLRNSLLSGSSLDIDEIRNKVKSTLREAWRATVIMDGFDLESDFKTRYNQNRSTLKSLCSQMDVPTYGSTSSTPSYGVSSSTRTTVGHVPQSNNNSGSGCMVTLFAIMGMAAMSIYCIISIL